MKRFGVLLALVALAASGPSAAMGGFGGGHIGGLRGHFGGFGGRCMAMGGFNRGFGFNRGISAGRSVAAAVASFPERVFLNPGSTEYEKEIGNMANGQITIHQSHLPHHFFVSVPVDLAGSSYEKATEMAYIVLTKSRKGYWRLKDQYRNDLTGDIHCQFGPNSKVTADAKLGSTGERADHADLPVNKEARMAWSPKTRLPLPH